MTGEVNLLLGNGAAPFVSLGRRDSRFQPRGKEVGPAFRGEGGSHAIAVAAIRPKVEFGWDVVGLQGVEVVTAVMAGEAVICGVG